MRPACSGTRSQPNRMRHEDHTACRPTTCLATTTARKPNPIRSGPSGPVSCIPLFAAVKQIRWIVNDASTPMRGHPGAGPDPLPRALPTTAGGEATISVVIPVLNESRAAGIGPAHWHKPRAAEFGAD